MRLKDKLAQLDTSRLAPPSAVNTPAPPQTPAERALTPEEAAKQQRVTQLRRQLGALGLRGRGGGAAVAQQRAAPGGRAGSRCDPATLPVACDSTAQGPLYRRTLRYAAAHRHGAAPVADALAVQGELLAAFALDDGLAEVVPHGMLFVDTETTGLAGGTGTLPFLIGLGWFEGEQFVVEQLLLPGPGRELPMLQRLHERVSAAQCLVTYNGKSFDWPLLRTRLTLNRLPLPRIAHHLDLLHGMRRVYKERLQQVRLVSVERELLGFERVDDIDGALIPQRYFDYLAGAHGENLEPILRHNADDIVALAAMLGAVARAFGTAGAALDARDHLGYARTAMRAGAASEALSHAQMALQQGRSDAQMLDALRLQAELHRKAQRFADSAAALREALGLATGQAAAQLHLALSKLYEHRLKDCEVALAHAQACGDAEEPEVHDKRIERLQQRLRRQVREEA